MRSKKLKWHQDSFDQTLNLMGMHKKEWWRRMWSLLLELISSKHIHCWAHRDSRASHHSKEQISVSTGPRYLTGGALIMMVAHKNENENLPVVELKTSWIGTVNLGMQQKTELVSNLHSC